MLTHQSHIFHRMNRAFGDHNTVIRNGFQHTQRCLQADFKSTQVAIVDTQQRQVERQCPRQLIRIVYLYQHIHTQRCRYCRKFVQLCIIQCCNNQQNAIGSDSACFIHLIRINNKILANDRQCAGGAGLLQIRFRALKKVLISEYRQTGCTALFV